MVPPLLAKEFVQTSQQANVEYIETRVSTYYHWRNSLRGAVPLRRQDTIYTLPCYRVKLPSGVASSSHLLRAVEDLLQSGFVSRCDFLTCQAEDLRISQPCSCASRGQHVLGRLWGAGQYVLQ